MRKIVLAVLALFVIAPAGPAAAQALLNNICANCVVGRLGIGPGPGEAIPFTVLQSALGAVSLSGNNTFSGTNNFTGTFEIGGVTLLIPGSGHLVGTSDTQALTNKSIDGSEINSGTINGAQMAAVALGSGGNGGVGGTLGVANGGTGQTSLAANGTLVGEGSGGFHSVATNAVGQCWVSQGPGVDPNWGSCATGSVATAGTYITVNGTVVAAPFMAAPIYAGFGGI